jgi:outer membrane protein assembly factor BamB
MKFRNLQIGLLMVITCLWAWNATTNVEPITSTHREWHQWRGPNRDGISHETGLITSWPEAGPREVWRISLGDGFSGISISNGRAYTMYAKGEDEIVVCFDAKTGEEIWRYLDDYRFENRQGGDGPRSTPTVDGDSVYVLSAHGRLVALDALTGKERWGYDFTKAFESQVPQHGFSTSPVVEENLLLVEVGGTENRAIIAFNKEKGDIVWNTQDDSPAYSSPITVTIHNVRQAIFFTADGLVSVSPQDGQVYWRYTWHTSYNVNAATPIFFAPDKIFISSGYDTGAALVQIEETDGKLSVSEIWRSRVMKNHFGSSILHEGYLYGFDDGTLKCIEANTGEEQWRNREFRKGTLILADGHLIVLGEGGNLALVKASHAEYLEVAQTQILNGRCWTAPSVSDGKLYLRNNEELVCLDLKEAEPQ